MKYMWLILGIVFLVSLLVLYFQLFVYANYTMPFFASFIDISTFAIYLILLAFFSGMFIILGIKGFMSGSNDIDDDFNL